MQASLSKPPSRKLGRFLFCFSLLILFLLAWGGLVRNLGAGLSCPDWPLCFGRLIPHFDLGIFAEFFHRCIAGLVSIGILGLSVYVFSNPARRKAYGRLMALALALLMAQVVLGGLTVLEILKSEIVTLHLGTGTLFFATVLMMAMRAWWLGDHPENYSVRENKRPEPGSIFRLGVMAATVLYFQIILGGTVSSHAAGLACPSFPSCAGTLWWPGIQTRAGLHMLHRAGAVVTFFVVLAFYISLEKSDFSKKVKRLGRLIAALLLVQWGLGISNVIGHLPVSVDVGHLFVAESLFACLLIASYEIRHEQLHQAH